MAVRTALRFVESDMRSFAQEDITTVTIEFVGREFGWVMPTSPANPDPGEPERGPMVTTIFDDTDEEWWKAIESAQRLVSALAFHFDVRIESRPTSGGSGEGDLLHPYGASELRDTFGLMTVNAPRTITVRNDPALRLALGHYREGLNAGSPFYRFLAFWNVIDAVAAGQNKRRDKILRELAPLSGNRVTITGDVADHLREASRNAVAHVIRRKGTVTIDPDLPVDRVRLDAEGTWMKNIARRAIYQRWPTPVEWT